jgi:hypothetical protein
MRSATSGTSPRISRMWAEPVQAWQGRRGRPARARADDLLFSRTLRKGWDWDHRAGCHTRRNFRRVGVTSLRRFVHPQQHSAAGPYVQLAAL